MKTKVFLIILIILKYLLPISNWIKYILINIKYKSVRGKYKYKDTHGGFKINSVFTKEELNNFCIYVVPDNDLATTYYRLINNKPQFKVTFSFDELLNCNKSELLKYTATKKSYKEGKINNFNFKTNYENH